MTSPSKSNNSSFFIVQKNNDFSSLSLFLLKWFYVVRWDCVNANSISGSCSIWLLLAILFMDNWVREWIYVLSFYLSLSLFPPPSLVMHLVEAYVSFMCICRYSWSKWIQHRWWTVRFCCYISPPPTIKLSKDFIVITLYCKYLWLHLLLSCIAGNAEGCCEN